MLPLRFAELLVRTADPTWLMVLRDIDDRARQCGVEVCTIDEAVNHLRNLDADDAWE